MFASPRCLYYAFGGGLGHATRAIALARQLRRMVGGDHYVLVNTPLAETLISAGEAGVSIEPLSPHAGAGRALEFVASWFDRLRPHLLIVDTFPRGLGGELAVLLLEWPGLPCVLIGRVLPREYVERYELARMVGERYELAIAAGEASRLVQSCGGITTAPFLIRDWAELPSRQEAARILRSHGDRSVVLLVGSGTVEECREMHRLANELAGQWRSELPPLRLACPEGAWSERRDVPHLAMIEHYPLMEVLPAVRLLIGGAGCNLVHESRAVGVPGLFVPRERKYDNQSGRLERDERLNGNMLAAICRELGKVRPAIREFSNGAVEAAEAIARLL